MGNQAIVAFRNSDGTYDLHRSPDGATNYQLLVPLSIAATTDDTAYRDFVASFDAPEAALDTQGGLDQHFAQQRAEHGEVEFRDGDASTLLEADPFETDVPREQIMETLTPEPLHLYVVADGLSLYYPAWGSIGLLSWFTDTVRLHAYDRNRVQSAAQIDALVDKRPDYTYEGDDFAEMAHGAPSDDRYQLFRDNFQTIGARLIRDAFEYDAHGGAVELARIITPEWVFVAEPLSDSVPTPDRVARALYPIRVSLDSTEDIDAVDAELQSIRETVANKALYIDAMLLSTNMSVGSDAVFANSGEMFLDNLIDDFPGRIDDSLLPFDL